MYPIPHRVFFYVYTKVRIKERSYLRYLTFDDIHNLLKIMEKYIILCTKFGNQFYSLLLIFSVQ